MPIDFKTYQVRAHNVGQPLSALLKRIYPGKSWSEVRRLVTARHIQISGNLCTDETRRLKAGEVVRIYGDSLEKPADEQQIEIRYQDEHLMVVEKPAGVTTLRHIEEQHWDQKRKNRQPTLDELLQRIVDKAGTRPTPGRGVSNGAFKHANQSQRRNSHKRGTVKIRPVHRLDRDTSGLMIFALSSAAEQALVRDFAKHAISRAYWAVIHGAIAGPNTFTSWIVSDRGDGLRGSASPESAGAKKAITHVKPIRRIGPYTLIECTLETGRTHQIRIHLSEAGHRLCGEGTYNRPVSGEPVPDESGAPRQALHACRLAFEHPVTNQAIRFEMKMPADLQRWIKKIEADAEGSDQPEG